MLVAGGDLLNRPRFDLDAGVWFVVAFVATAFGILPLLAVPMLLGVGRMSDSAYLVADAGLKLVVYGVAAALLVRARPWRRLVDLVATMWVLFVGAAVLMSVVYFLASPGSMASIVRDVASALTFGLVQLESVDPLKLGIPDVAPYVGLALGFWIETARLRRAGRPVGEDARPRVELWDLGEESRG